MIVIGGGLAGLTAALRLVEAGRAVTVLEAEPDVGGRARTLAVGGEPLDRGFQSLFTAYPATARLLRDIGIEKADLVAFDRGAVVHDGLGWSRMESSPAGALRFQWFSRGDLVRLARLGADVAAAPVSSLLWGDEAGVRADDYLRGLGFSSGAMECFFRPLFGVITADRTLSTDAGYFRFLLKMMLRGRAVIPVEGHGMIAAWTAARVRQLGGDVRTGTAVAALETAGDDRGRVTGVRLGDGERLEAAGVIVACGADAARGLLVDLDRQAARALDLRPRGVTTLAYSLSSSFHTGKTIVLNAAPHDGGARIDLVCQESNLLRPGARDGVRLLATSVHGDDGAPDPDALASAMARVAEAWNPGFPWRETATLEEVIEHPTAQFAVPPGVRADLPDAATGLENVFLAGDFTAHPSIEGAVGSGDRAAEVARVAIGRTQWSGVH
jgi:protoporphyrinogen oxidase